MHPWDASGWVTVDGVDVHVCRGTRPGPRAVITGGIHGDEYEGPVAALELVRTLRAEEISGTVAVVPVANPGAVAAGTRASPADGGNLARSFPGNVDGNETERLAAGLFAWMRHASFAIDLHSGGVEYDFAPLGGFYGAPAAGNPSFEAAQRFGLPYLWALPPTPGVLSNALWDLGIPVVGCEYRGCGRLDAGGVEAYAEGVRSCLRHWGVLVGVAGPPQGRVVTGDWQLASTTGFFIAEKVLGDTVQASETIAHIVDPRGNETQRFCAPHDGLVLALRSKAFITEGSWGVLSVKHA